MCGIMGIVGRGAVAERLVQGLKRLEYRGYDSSGIAVLNENGLGRRRAQGKIVALEAAIAAEPLDGPIGIAHTRWATHGKPSERNAHPHRAGRVTVVHNGIIENFRSLRDRLTAQGRVFETETDTETVAHLIDHHMQRGHDAIEATRQALNELEGAYALGILFDDHPDMLIGARHGSPLVIGVQDGEMLLGSDAYAVAPFTNRVIYLEEGDWAVLTPDAVRVFDLSGAAVERVVRTVGVGADLAEKGNFRHFMEKEIHEQPDAIARTLSSYVDPADETIRLPEGIDFAAIDRLQLVACGTACYAGQIAKYWFEQIAGLPTDVDIGSEFRYRQPVLSPRTLAIAISQSGETADTKAALELCRDAGLKTAGVVNVPESTIARLADVWLPTHAGPEIGVASTKAFTCQLSVLAALAVAAARQRGRVDAAGEAHLVRQLLSLPRLLGQALETESQLAALAQDIAKARDVLYLGRGSFYPLALEAALKLKEISYIHAEGYAAGELKHGPIALIDEVTPVVVVAPEDALLDKTVSSIEEVAARGAKVILITDDIGETKVGSAAAHVVRGPKVDPFLAPIVYAPTIQLLAYHVAVYKGTDVDQPRNLAKSVTVE